MTAPVPPAQDVNHQLVVRIVVLSLAALTFLLYGAAVVLSALELQVPGELWLGAGNASGALAALLVNSKSTAAQEAGQLLEQGSTLALQAAARAGVPPAVAAAAADRVGDVALEAVEQAADQVQAELAGADEQAQLAQLDQLEAELPPAAVGDDDASAAAAAELEASTARRSTRRKRST